MLNTRIAVEDDIPAIAMLIRAAMSGLMTDFLSEAQIKASFHFMGVDTQLIADRTYFVVESHGEIVGCGGWSRRATLYGGDHSQATRNAALLNPQTDAARIRAMYTRPDHVRRGVGRLILEECEAAASAAGFTHAELMSTLPGEPFYQACGYTELDRAAEVVEDVEVPLIRMRKALAPKPHSLSSAQSASHSA